MRSAQSGGGLVGRGLDLPDFLIIGAPKCGTSALHAYLSAHPGVFTPQIKEPHFFCADFRGLSRVQTLEDYQALFSSAPAGALKGEASATYLFSEVAVGAIMQAQPAARIVVTLRDPLHAVRSYHRQLLKGLLEDIEDFEEAWRAWDDRVAGRRLPAQAPAPAILNYGATYRYAPQLRRLFSQAPRDQIHIIVHEEFFADPATGYARLLNFLGLEDDGRREFGVHNQGGDLRSRALAGFYLSPPPLFRALWRPFRALAHRAGLYPPEILQALNVAHRPPPALPAALQEELRSFFASDIAETEALLGRDLSVWRG